MTPALSSLLTVIGLWLVLSFLCCGSSFWEDKPLSPGEVAEAQRAKEQACNTTERLKSAGAFTKVEQDGDTSVTHAYVNMDFYSIPVDAKERTIKWVALCYVDIYKRNQPGLVIVHDGFSGKQIGTFDFSSGLTMRRD